MMPQKNIARFLVLFCAAALLLVLAPPSASAQQLSSVLEKGFTYRNLGPYRAGAWVNDIAVPETPQRDHLYTMYVAVRHGGVWKTTNNGTTFEPIFDDQDVFSIGSVEVAPSDANIVWVGTGDDEAARSTYAGNGVYKSTDAGKTWQHMGLEETHHIARIIIHPTNPNIVYIAALGHLFSTNEERGIFKTEDGGKTWTKLLYTNDRTGVVDLVINRSEPNTLYAATYEVLRRPWTLEDGGLATGIHKTTDGGKTWQRLEGGLPTGPMGRIGLDLYQKDPRILYAVIDNRNVNPKAPPPTGGRLPDLMGGQVYRTDDAGKTWRMTNTEGDDPSGKSAYAFNELWIDPNNPDRIFITGSSLSMSEDGGKTLTSREHPGRYRAFGRAFGDFRTLWIDPQDSERMIAGSDGGVFQSYDGGITCVHLWNIPAGEIYALTVDMENPYNIYAGLQDHESWKGPVNSWSGRIDVSNWVTVGTGDGMYNQVDPTDSRWVYNNQEFGRHQRFNQVTRERTAIAPEPPQGEERLRWNWTNPLRLSPHNPSVLYTGAQYLFRSMNRGDSWQKISPDLTTNDPAKISPPGTSIQHCTILTISESPLTPGVIWVGTDDGKVQLTRNGGAEWSDLSGALVAAGAPKDGWVSRVFASNFDEGTAYVSTTRHRFDDFRPFLLKTTDYGKTWKLMINGLPQKPVNVVVEDDKNRDLVFAGTDGGVFVSVDGGQNWSSLRGNMPPAPVHDMVIHPREADLVVGTYGRGAFVTNITPLREINQKMLSEAAYFFAPQAKGRRVEGALGNYRLYGDQLAWVPNEPNGITLAYYLKEAGSGNAKITIKNLAGDEVTTLQGSVQAGINRAVWSLEGRGGGFGAFRGGSSQPPPAPGNYVATIEVAGKTLTQNVTVLEPVILAP